MISSAADLEELLVEVLAVREFGQKRLEGRSDFAGHPVLIDEDNTRFHTLGSLSVVQHQRNMSPGRSSCKHHTDIGVAPLADHVRTSNVAIHTPGAVAETQKSRYFDVVGCPGVFELYRDTLRP